MNMRLEVLLSCMNQEGLSIIEKCKIKSDVLVINQHSYNAYIETIRNGSQVRMLTVNQRGLSKSRNLALSLASGDICVFCDDDVTYLDGYDKTIVEAFNALPEADIIIFDTVMLNVSSQRKPILKVREAPKYRSYGSVRIAFRLNSVRRANIWFDPNFGAGATFSSGEEALWLQAARRKGLRIYEFPATICAVDYAQSTGSL